MSKIVFTVKSCVVSENGTIDRAASEKKFWEAVAAMQSQEGANDDAFRQSIIATLEAGRLDKMNKTGNTGSVLDKVVFDLMKKGLVTQETLTGVKSELVAYLAANTGEVGEGKLFGSRKGPGGGHWLWTNKPSTHDDYKNSVLRAKAAKEKAQLAEYVARKERLAQEAALALASAEIDTGNVSDDEVELTEADTDDGADS